MKTNILVQAAGLLFVTAFVSTSSLCAYADDSTAAVTKEKSYSGTVTYVDTKDNMLKVRGYLLNKYFVMGDNVSFELGDKKSAALADFRPGQKVDILYKDLNGVRVASRITQQKLYYSGEVSAIDLNNHKMTVRMRGATKTFVLAENCNVILNGKSKGAFEDVKLGHHVTITYEVPQNELVARQIEQKSSQYVGTLSAINLPERTVTAGKRFLGDKRFHLADNCVIINDGKMEGRINDLQIGQNYELSYDTVDGINVVNRIAPVTSPDKTEVTERSSTTMEPVRR